MAYYGTSSGVAALLRPITTISATSTVTTTDVTNDLTAMGAIIDLHLAAAGYTTSVTASGALTILNRCANLKEAGDVYARLVGQGRYTADEDYGAVWRAEADATLAAIYSGAATLPGAARASTVALGDSPTSGTMGGTSTPAFPRSATENFIDYYGDNFSGGVEDA